MAVFVTLIAFVPCMRTVISILAVIIVAFAWLSDDASRRERNQPQQKDALEETICISHGCSSVLNQSKQATRARCECQCANALSIHAHDGIRTQPRECPSSSVVASVGARSIDVERSLNPALQTFDQWLAQNKNRISFQ